MSVKSQLHYPGTISKVDPHGHYPGVAVKKFWTIRGYRKFFHEDPNKAVERAMVVISEQFVPYFFNLLTAVIVTFTTQLDPTEEQDFQEVTREVEFGMAKRRQQRAEARAEEEKVKNLAEAEVRRLAQVGKKYEDRVAHRKSLSPGDSEYKAITKALDAGDPDVLFITKTEAFQAGYVHGNQEAVAELTRKDTK